MEYQQLEPDLVRPIRPREFLQMVAAGIFGDERVELLEGVIYRMTPPLPDPPHASPVDDLSSFLVVRLLHMARVRTQQAFLTPDSVVGPDIAVVPQANYSKEHPRRAHLIVEVSWTSLPIDTRKKPSIYARAKVRDYWVVNVPDQVVHVYRRPERGAYRQVKTYEKGQRIALLAFKNVSVDVTALFEHQLTQQLP